MSDSPAAHRAPYVCSTCGVAWTNHVGLAGTCALLAESRAEVDRLTANATAREGVTQRQLDLLRAAERARDDVLEAVDAAYRAGEAAFCDVPEGTPTPEPPYGDGDTRRRWWLRGYSRAQCAEARTTAALRAADRAVLRG